MTESVMAPPTARTKFYGHLGNVFDAM